MNEFKRYDRISWAWLRLLFVFGASFVVFKGAQVLYPLIAAGSKELEGWAFPAELLAAFLVLFPAMGAAFAGVLAGDHVDDGSWNPTWIFEVLHRNVIGNSLWVHLCEASEKGAEVKGMALGRGVRFSFARCNNCCGSRIYLEIPLGGIWRRGKLVLDELEGRHEPKSIKCKRVSSATPLAHIKICLHDRGMQLSLRLDDALCFLNHPRMWGVIRLDPSLEFLFGSYTTSLGRTEKELADTREACGKIQEQVHILVVARDELVYTTGRLLAAAHEAVKAIGESRRQFGRSPQGEKIRLTLMGRVISLMPETDRLRVVYEHELQEVRDREAAAAAQAAKV